jgi:hypothetical protein
MYILMIVIIISCFICVYLFIYSTITLLFCIWMNSKCTVNIFRCLKLSLRDSSCSNCTFTLCPHACVPLVQNYFISLYGIPQTPYCYNLSTKEMYVQYNLMLLICLLVPDCILSIRFSIICFIFVAIASFVDLFLINPHRDLLSMLCLFKKKKKK